ncbi:PD-(D/E)XK motif protein [Actinokineospora sp. G85]|uniref:PD-(D/E)XK motif protein n=1 Tax=Actinokineospora sp. G85 TaxID=3406626 RepID=UPI003C7788DF
MTTWERHTSTENFDLHLANRAAAVFRIAGTPGCSVFVDPLKPELGLRVEVDKDTAIPETGLRNILARRTSRDGKWFLEVVVTAQVLFRDAYPLLCAMADRVQVEGMAPGRALAATLDSMSTLLRSPGGMPLEREVGLFGELLLLRGLITAIGSTDGVRAWRGGLAEEHDFGLPAIDVEVKTTTGERRVHWIESLTQLVPTGGRPLWLVSYQITSAGSGDGVALPDLVDELRGLIGTGPESAAFEGGLEGSGWREDSRGQLTTRWTPRTDTASFEVTDAFPRLTPDDLRQAGVLLDRIPQIRYRIDLDGLPRPTEAPLDLATAVAHKG